MNATSSIIYNKVMDYIILGNPIDIILNEFKYFYSKPVDISFSPGLEEMGVFGFCIFNEYEYPRIEIASCLNIGDTALVVAHELAHVLDMAVNGRWFKVARGMLANTPEWHHDEKWTRFYKELMNPLRHFPFEYDRIDIETGLSK